MFEKHQDDRKKLFAAAQRAFSKMCPLAGSGAFYSRAKGPMAFVLSCPLSGFADIHCPVPLCNSGDEFQQNTWIAKSLEKQLAVMPCLHGSSSGFIVSLAKAVEPRLLIAGQEIFLSSNKDRIIDPSGT